MDALRSSVKTIAGVILVLFVFAMAIWAPWDTVETARDQPPAPRGSDDVLPVESERRRSPVAENRHRVEPAEGSGFIEILDLESMTPASGVRLALRSVGASSVVAESDAQGLIEAPAGSWHWELVDGTGYRNRSGDVAVEPGGMHAVYLSKLESIRLRIVDPDGSGVAGARVRVRQVCDEAGFLAGVPRDVVEDLHADGVGIVEFLRLGATDCRALVHAPGYAPVEVVPSPRPGSREILVQLVRTDGETLLAELVDLDGVPLGGAEIVVTPPGMRCEMSLGATNDWGGLEVPAWVRDCQMLRFIGSAFPSRARKGSEWAGDSMRFQVPRAVRGRFVDQAQRDIRGVQGTVEGDGPSKPGIASVPLQVLGLESEDQALCLLPAKANARVRLTGRDGRAWSDTVLVLAHSWVLPAHLDLGPLAAGRRGVTLHSKVPIERVDLRAGSSNVGPIPGLVLEQGALIARFSLGMDETWLRVVTVGAADVLVVVEQGKDDLDVQLLEARLSDVVLDCRDKQGRVVRDIRLHVQRLGDAWSGGAAGVKQQMAAVSHNAIPGRDGLVSTRLLPGRYLIRASFGGGRLCLDSSVAVVPSMMDVGEGPVRVSLEVPRPRRCMLDLKGGPPTGAWVVRDPSTGAALSGYGEWCEFLITDRSYSLEWSSADGRRQQFAVAAGDEPASVHLVR